MVIFLKYTSDFSILILSIKNFAITSGPKPALPVGRLLSDVFYYPGLLWPHMINSFCAGTHEKGNGNWGYFMKPGSPVG